MIKALALGFRKILPQGVRAQIGRAGHFFAPPSITYPSVEAALLYLKEKGFNPRFCVDIGAYVGEWTADFKSIYPNCRMLMVEAQESKREPLQLVRDRFNSSVDFRIALLGPVSGRKVSFVEMETGSSVFEEQSHFERNVAQKTTISLDDLLKSEELPVDFLKLDVQGYELEVLKGASHTLTQAQIVLMEVSFVPSNQGAPLAAEVIHFMDEKGFRLMDFCSQIRRKDGILWQTDLLFVANTSSFVPDPKLTKDNWH